MKKEGCGPLFLLSFLIEIINSVNPVFSDRVVLCIMYLVKFCLSGKECKEVVTVTADENIQKQQSPEKTKDSWQKSVLLYLHDLVYMLAGIMLVFLLLFRMVIVSGSSMYDTLRDGDWLLLISNVFYQDPEYGDIIVASKESFNDGEAIIKRVIATEGQIVDIDFDNGIVYVDGTPLDEPYTYTLTNIPEGMAFPLLVRENCVFAMGDNRNDSKDSRHPQIGLIDEREILGKAILLVFPGTGEQENMEPRDFDRIGVIN